MQVWLHSGSGVVWLCLVSAGGAWAQNELVTKYGPLLDQCYEQVDGAEAKADCIGVLSMSCMTKEDGGETTLGMPMCNSAETEFWDGLLNDEYRQTMSWAKQMDAEDQQYFPEFAEREDASRSAQRAWVTFRDAECGLDYAIWGAGSMRHIAGTNCLLTLTAERTIEVRAKRELMQ